MRVLLALLIYWAAAGGLAVRAYLAGVAHFVADHAPLLAPERRHWLARPITHELARDAAMSSAFTVLAGALQVFLCLVLMAWLVREARRERGEA